MSANEFPLRISKWINPNSTIVDQVAPNCPRCASSNTKFCYYNNYSLSQPRYFCKSCRRYWTKGGSLRNVPVGGACRKTSRRHTTAAARPSRQCCETTTIDVAVSSASEREDGAVLVSGGGPGSPGASDNYLLQKPAPSDRGGDRLLYEYVDGEDHAYQGYSNGFEWEGFVEADTVWSEGTKLASFESTVDLKDLGMFTADERFGLSENWGSLDQCVYEMFGGL